MKTAAQVFIIIGMVCGFWAILPLIFGGIALSQMSKGQRPSTGMSVCVLLFCNMIGGILLLCAKDEDFYNPNMNSGYRLGTAVFSLKGLMVVPVFLPLTFYGRKVIFFLFHFASCPFIRPIWRYNSISTFIIIQLRRFCQVKMSGMQIK